MKFFVSLFYSLFCCFSLSAQSTCELVTSASLQRLPALLIKNDFTQIESISNTLLSSCEKSELALRLQIIRSILLRNDSKSAIQQYIDGGYDQILISRYDAAAKEDYNNVYKRSPEKYQFLPLNHAVDSLIKQKAIALLHSDAFTLTPEESSITLLFADQINEFNKSQQSTGIKKVSAIEKYDNLEHYKEKIGVVVYLGAFMPIGTNDYLKTSPTLGASIMSPLSKQFIFEGTLRFRFNSNNESFKFRDANETKDIKSSTSFFLGANLGYKILDNGPWIISPKVGAGLGFINTNLSTTSYYNDQIYSEYDDSGSATKYNNVNTFHSVVGIAFMRHLNKKLYIGIEANYHHIPYNVDKDLITRIDKNFSSIELFLRF